MYTDIEHRVTNLEQLFAEFVKENRDMQRAARAAEERYQKESQEIKRETQRLYAQHSKEMRDLQAHTDASFERANASFINLHREMQAFKEEIRLDTETLKQEMQDFKEEMRQDRRDMNKKWGELANKMGTVVEDIIAPAVRPAIEQYFKEDVTYRAVNVRKKDTSSNLRGEFDVVATTQSFVFLVETKTSPRPNNLTELLEVIVPRSRSLFPEYDHLTLIPFMAGLRFEDSFLPLATEAGVYLLAYREWDYMDLLNFDAIQSKDAA